MQENKYTTIFTNESEPVSHSFNLPDGLIYLTLITPPSNLIILSNRALYSYLLSDNALNAFSQKGHLNYEIHNIKKNHAHRENRYIVKKSEHLLISTGKIDRIEYEIIHPMLKSTELIAAQQLKRARIDEEWKVIIEQMAY